MDKQTNENNKQQEEKKGKRLPKWLRISLKTIAWVVGTLIVLTAGLLATVVWVLTPERLTSIAERLANENLNAKVDIERMELTVWHSFPKLIVDIKGLNVNSKAFEGKGLPASADSLLSLQHGRVAINLAELALMRVNVDEILLDGPRINFVAASDSLNNAMIFPPSAESDTTSTPLPIKSIVVKKLNITNNRGIAYTDMAGGMKAALLTDSLSLNYGNDHFYRFHTGGRVDISLPELKQSIPFAIAGDAKWEMENPLQFTVRQLTASVADITASISADASLEPLAVNQLEMTLGPVVLDKVRQHVPEQYAKRFDMLATDLAVSVQLKLAKPFHPDKEKYPTFHAGLQIPNCYVANTKKGNRIDEFAIDANLDFDGAHPEKSRLTLGHILLEGFGIHLKASGDATNLFKDPKMNTKISGSVNFAQVLGIIPKEMPFELAGKFALDTDVKFALSDLSVNTFHRMQVNGTASLEGVRYFAPADSLLAFVNNTSIRFGTNSQFKGADDQMKNILMASVKLDSVGVESPAMRLTVKDFSVGMGSLGEMKDLLDTTQITPLGARIRLGRLMMLSKADSTRLRIVDMESNGSIKRFAGTYKPLFAFDISAGRINYTDPLTSLNLREGDIRLEANPRVRDRSRWKARLDSLCEVYPTLPRDSVKALYIAEMRKKFANLNTVGNSEEYIDMAVDNEFRRLFYKWDMRGQIKARRGRLFTPYFPVKNVLKNIDMTFNTQRFDLHNLTYTAGKSDLQLKGSITNIDKAVYGLKAFPLTVKLEASSNKLDLNELMAAAYKGSSFSTSAESATFNISNTTDENKMQEMIDASSASTDTLTHAMLVPKNVALDVVLKNKQCTYTDFLFNDLYSEIHMNNGVLYLKNVSGKSEEGNLRLDLVYATANRNDIGMGLSLRLDKMKIGRVMQLIPGIDTIMPMFRGIDGIVNARLATTTKVDSLMNIITPTTNAVLDISGKDLVLIDSETFRQIGKLLRFKDRDNNVIDSLKIQAKASNSQLDIYPFILNVDRYKLGVSGWNDFETNYKYHISVLESPLFFKFGINISGNVMEDKMKFSLGKAKLKEQEVASSSMIADTTNINLMRRMGEIFRRGAEAGLRENEWNRPTGSRRRALELEDEKLSHADSLKLIEQGLIEKPDTTATRQPAQPADNKTKRNKKKENNSSRKPVDRPAAITTKEEKGNDNQQND